MGLIAQTNLRKEVLPLAIIHQGFRQLAVFGFLLGFLTLSGFGVSAAWWWLIPLVVCQALLSPLVACLRHFWCFSDDFRLLIQLGTLFLLFMSGVFWDFNAITDDTLREALIALKPSRRLLMPTGRSCCWVQRRISQGYCACCWRRRCC